MGNKSVVYQTVLPASDEKSYETKYTEAQPSDEWMTTGFNDQQWKTGKAPFGNKEPKAGTNGRQKFMGEKII